MPRFTTFALLVALGCSLLLVACECSHPKLIRAKRSVQHKSVYFVKMKESVKKDRLHEYVSDLVALGKNSSLTGFKIEVHGIVQEVAHGFSAKLSRKALRKILSDEEVESVSEDHYLKAGQVQSRVVHTWGLDRLDGENSKHNGTYKTPCGLSGKGVDVYILDSGVRYTHSEFGNRAMSAGCDPIDQLFKTNRSGLDCTGHGTHVAGTVAGEEFGVAANATIFSVRVLDCSNLGSANSVILGIECVLKKHKARKRPSVVNLSIYGEKNLLVKRAIDTLMKNGISVVSIAGNNEQKPRDSCKVAPGSIHGVITASSSTRNDRPFHLSNAGVCVDLYAPGTGIQSASGVCDTCRSTRSGSSMAAPHVSGAIALLLEKCPYISPWRVRHILLSEMVQANKLDFSYLPRIYRQTTPNLLLHTSSLRCDLKC